MTNQEEKKILLIGETKEYLINVLSTKLQEEGFNNEIIDAKESEIDQKIEDAWEVILYISDSLVENDSLMGFIRDKILDAESPLFVVGEELQVDRLKKVIPENMIERIFYRPIDTTELVQFLKLYERKEKKRILVVDDSGVVLRNVKGWLCDGYHVEVANSGATAIRNMTLHMPDLVLLDYEMPVCDGPQVLEMIKAEPAFADIPVMFLTGISDRDSVMKGMALNPVGYLLKSQGAAEIRNAVDQFFARQKSLEKNKSL